MPMEQLNKSAGSSHSVQVDSPTKTSPPPDGSEGRILDEDEGSDVEVMQVVSEALNLRTRKGTLGGGMVNGAGHEPPEDLNRERPMSWEGELSEDGEEEDEMNQAGDPPTVSSSAVTVGSNSVVGVVTQAVMARPPSSPMCIQEKEEPQLNIINRVLNHTNGSLMKIPISRVDSPTTSTHIVGNGGIQCGVIGVAGHVTAAFTANSAHLLSGRSSFGGSGQSSPFLNERPSSIGPSTTPFENSITNHRSPAQSRHLVNFSGPYSQSPSPVLNRPTSSCSSRSSYSPTQSPLPGRHLTASASSAYSHTQSPVLSRHAAGTSSDGSVYSPTSSPLQGRHISVENGSAHYSPAQSPSQSRHVAVVVDSSNNAGVNNCLAGMASISKTSVPHLASTTPVQSTGFSPSQSPAHFRSSSAGSLLTRPVPFGGATPSPTPSSTSFHHHRSAGGTPVDQHHIFGSHPNEQGVSQTHLNQSTIIDCRSTTSSASVISSASDESNASDFSSPSRRLSLDNSSLSEDARAAAALAELSTQSPLGGSLISSASPGNGTSSNNNNGGGISRQQLLSGPCPICGDRISGFHYGIFSCESCKGFFKRTVQNKKNYVCLRGAKCTITISTRKKCPACRFDKCLKTGMKLEAIREDRTRGGRSTYQCSYTLATQSLSDGRVSSASDSQPNHSGFHHFDRHMDGLSYHSQNDYSPSKPSARSISDSGIQSAEDEPQGIVPPLMQEILAVEHLWHYTDREINRLSEQPPSGGRGAMGAAALGAMGMGIFDPSASNEPGQNDFISNLCSIADHRLYKIVKWCKSLPLFREIEIDDQIALLINSWCELLLLSCCYRSMGTPQEIRVSQGKSMSLEQAKPLGLGPVIERMLNLTEHMRRLQLDQYEYVCLKVIILLTSDVSGLKESEKVGICQKQVLEALQTYTRSHYPQQPSKFGELLLRIPELERACQVGKESLASKQRSGEVPSFNLLMELLRGDH